MVSNEIQENHKSMWGLLECAIASDYLAVLSLAELPPAKRQKVINQYESALGHKSRFGLDDTKKLRERAKGTPEIINQLRYHKEHRVEETRQECEICRTIGSKTTPT